MANTNNEVEIVVSTSSKKASTDIDLLEQALGRLQTRYNAITDRTTIAMNSLSRSVARIDGLNFKKFSDNLDKVGKKYTDFMTKFDNESTKMMSASMNVASVALENFNSSFKKFGNLKNIDLSNFEVLGTDKLKNIDTSSLEKMIKLFNDLSKANIEKTSRAINNLANGFKQLETVNFNSNMSGNLQSQMTAAAETLKGFMNKLEGFNADGFAKVALAMKSLPTAMKAMEKLDISKIGQVFSTLTTQIQPFIAKLKEGGLELNSFASIMSKFSGGSTTSAKKALNGVKKEVKDIGTESDRTNKKLGNMLSFGRIYAFYNQIRHFSKGFMELLNKSINFAEIENYFSRAMGNMRGEAMKFQETLSESFGMATPAIMQAQATFKNMIGALGGIDDATSYGLSERLTKMVIDYSSLYNTTIDSAITKFQAALSKQVRPIRSQSGYDITQKVLESTAQMIGINNRTITQMGEMEKRLLIILTLQSQMARSAAMGDFSRTIKFSGFTLRSVSNNLVNASKSGVVTVRYC